MISVMNKYRLADSGAVRINIMRGSALGNPFIIGKDGDRDDVCNKYEEHLKRLVEKKGEARKELARIYKLAKKGDVELVCCCKPKRCHSDAIKAFLDKFI